MLIPEVDLDIIPLDIFGPYTFVLTSLVLCKEIFAWWYPLVYALYR
jgi:hypothetical protein